MMPEKDPALWGTATWVLLITMSLLGGITSWYRRIKSGHKKTFDALELLGEISLSGLMGFCGFVIADWYFNSQSIAAAAAGISAHFAVRILFSAEGFIEVVAKRLTDKVKKA